MLGERDVSPRRAESGAGVRCGGVCSAGVRGVCSKPDVTSKTVSLLSITVSPVSRTVSAVSTSSRVPQFRQNLLPSGIARPHRMHFIAMVLRFSPPDSVLHPL